MATIREEWVRVPVEVVEIVPYGIGSAKITPEGDIEFTIAAGKGWAEHVQSLIRQGKVVSLTLSANVATVENPTERV